MAREVVESVRIVIKTEDGNRLETSGKGSAPQGMLTAFICLPAKRREWLLRKMWEKHQAMLTREAEPETGHDEP
jgi:hypothetical protein